MNRSNLVSIISSLVGLVFVIVGFAAPLWLVYEQEPENFIVFKTPKKVYYCNLMTCSETTTGTKERFDIPGNDDEGFLATTIFLCLIGVVCQVFLHLRNKLAVIICFFLNFVTWAVYLYFTSYFYEISTSGKMVKDAKSYSIGFCIVGVIFHCVSYVAAFSAIYSQNTLSSNNFILSRM